MNHARTSLSRRALIGALGALVAGAVALPALADSGLAVSSMTITTTPVSSCVSLSHNFSEGASDATTSGDVTRLQSYLARAGYLGTASVIGSFGPLTQSAVIAFQKANGLNAQGYVGPLTRARIQSLSCGGATTGSPSIQALAPATAAIGQTITIVGSGFTAANVVHVGPGGIGNIASTDGGTKISFTVPNAIGPYCKPGQACPMYMARLTTPGEYPLYVENDNGVSNSVILSVSSTTANAVPPTISSITMPAKLTTGQAGTFVVNTIFPAGLTGHVHYVAKWGDEAAGVMGMGVSAPAPQAFAAFSHTYYQPGTFTPTFTVFDDFGNVTTATSSITVQ